MARDPSSPTHRLAAGGRGTGKGRPRVIVVFLVMAVALAGVLGRLFILQIRDHRGLSERADRQYHRLVPLSSKRGAITDRNGRELAVSLQAPSVFARPSAVLDPGGAAAALGARLGVPRAQVLERLRADRAFGWIGRAGG